MNLSENHPAPATIKHILRESIDVEKKLQDLRANSEDKEVLFWCNIFLSLDKSKINSKDLEWIYLQRAHEVYPYHHTVNIMIASYYFDQGDYFNALFYNMFGNQENSETLFQRGCILEGLGKKELALKSFILGRHLAKDNDWERYDMRINRLR